MELFIGEGFEDGLGRQFRDLAFLLAGIQFEVGSEPDKLAISSHDDGGSFVEALVVGLRGKRGRRRRVREQGSEGVGRQGN